MIRTLIGIFCSGIVLTSTCAFGSTSVGNGGIVVSCPGKPLVLLDLFENEDLPLELGAASLTVVEKAEVSLERLRRLSPKRSIKYKQNLAAFIDSADFVKGPLEQTDDLGNLKKPIPSGCSLKQLAYQMPNTAGDRSRRLTIDVDLYNELSSDQQAAFYIHEVVLEEAVAWGAETSTWIRRFTSWLCSSKFNRLSLSDFAEMVRAAELGGVEFSDLTFALRSVSGKSLALHFWDPYTVRVGSVNQPTKISVGGSIFLAKGLLWFDKLGRIEEFHLSKVVFQPHVDPCLGQLNTSNNVRVKIRYESGKAICQTWPPLN